MHSGSAWNLKPVAEMSDTEFVHWCQLLESRSGMVLNEQQRTFLQVNLTSRMRELGLDNYSYYYQQVLHGPSAAIEWSSLLDKLTVQETQFFRHPPSYAYASQFLRQLVQQERKKPLAIWSVGCSTGEEPWSLSITAAEALAAENSELGFAVTATDISHNALRKAREATYTKRRLDALDANLLQDYFVRLDNGKYQVIERLRQRVCFARLNVLELSNAPMTGMDLIFCQNLLIYFRRWQRREILNHLAVRLAPGGIMILGLGEISGWENSVLEPIKNDQVLAFRRTG